MRSVSPVPGALASPTAAPPPVAVDALAAGYRGAGASERRLIEAAERCIVRWGIRKTSLDDIAREAGVSRATVYRAFPGGKDRVVDAVAGHAVGRFFHALAPELSAAASLEDLLVVGVGALLREAADNRALPSLIEREPDVVLPHFAFHELDRLFDLAEAVSRPQLERFLAPAAVRPAAELLTRCVLTFAFQPARWLDAHDDGAVRRFVRTYLVPAVSGTATSDRAPSHPTPTPTPDRPPAWEHLP